ncbi:MAG: hypothetical protein ABIG11_10920 [bacterium]
MIMGYLAAIRVLVFHSLREQWKSRFLQLVIIFAGVMLYASLLLGAMAVEQEGRVLTDFGLALLELAGLAAVILSSSTTIQSDMESKTIYLVLCRPVPRSAYLLGKLSGILVSVAFAVLCMGFLHASLLTLRGIPIPPYYAQALLFSWVKLAIIGSLAVAVSLFSTSVLSSVVISSIFWTLGHFLAEARYLLDKSSAVVTIMSRPLLYAVPNLALYNVKDRMDAAAAHPAWSVLSGYALLYIGACTLFSVALFRKKEF